MDRRLEKLDARKDPGRMFKSIQTQANCNRCSNDRERKLDAKEQLGKPRMFEPMRYAGQNNKARNHISDVYHRLPKPY